MNITVSVALAIVSILLVLFSYFPGAPLVPIALILTDLAIIFLSR